MKIRIATIPTQGLKINDTLPLNSINDRLQEGHESDIRFTSAPVVQLELRATPDGAEAKGSVKATLMQPCSRCLNGVEREIEVETPFIIQARDQRLADPAQVPQDDIGIVFFDGEYVDLEDTLQQYLILSLSPFWHPPFEKDGTCRQCGMNYELTNEQEKEGAVIRLGDLLKKAGA